MFCKFHLHQEIIGLFLLCCSVGMSFVSAYAQGTSFLEGWQFNIDNKLGVASYEEDESGIEGEWRDFYYRLDTSLDNFRNPEIPIKLKAGFGYFIVPTDTETWHIEGIQFQTNDMDFWGLNPYVELGYRFDAGAEQALSLTPFIDYGYRHIKFKRTDFNIFNLITSQDIVSESYNIHYTGLGLYLDYALNEKWGIFSRLAYNYVVNNEAKNSELGTIDGAGGYLTSVDMGIEYRLNEQSSFCLGGFVELQHLRGGDTETVIWPDNDLNSYGGLIGYKYYFGADKPSAKKVAPEQISLPPITYRSKQEPLSVAKEQGATQEEYYKRIRGIIMAKVSPLVSYEEGEVYLALNIASSGRIEDVYIVEERSTASHELTSSVLQSISGLKQFPKFPKDIGKDKISLVVPIIISREGKKSRI